MIRLKTPPPSDSAPFTLAGCGKSPPAAFSHQFFRSLLEMSRQVSPICLSDEVQWLSLS